MTEVSLQHSSYCESIHEPDNHEISFVIQVCHTEHIFFFPQGRQSINIKMKAL